MILSAIGWTSTEIKELQDFLVSISSTVGPCNWMNSLPLVIPFDILFQFSVRSFISQNKLAAL